MVARVARLVCLLAVPSLLLAPGCASSPSPPPASASRSGAGDAVGAPVVAPSATPELSAATPSAPAIDPKAMPKQRALVLHAARYFDGKSDKVVDGGVTLLVENGLIVDLGKGTVKAPPNAETLDPRRRHVAPHGFIDAHTRT